MNYFICFFFAYLAYTLTEPVIINFIYLSNIDLFLNFILTKKQRNKLIDYIKNNY